MLNDPNQSEQGQDHTEFARIIAIAVLFTFAIVTFFFSMALIKDLETLRRAPELVWAFICGAPSEDGPALPLMLTISTLALLAGIGTTGWHIFKKRQSG